MPEYFPANICPTIVQGYAFGTPNNVLSIETMGGAPLQVLDYRTGPVEIGVTVIGGRLIRDVMSDFIYGKINAGADKFYMNLDSGFGIEEHIVQMVPQSVKFDGGSGPVWSISFTARAETTPAQEAPYGGNLVDLYAVYGDNIDELLAALDLLVNTELPVYF